MNLQEFKKLGVKEKMEHLNKMQKDDNFRKAQFQDDDFLTGFAKDVGIK